jgi:Family of unknown function (DUF5677)
MDSKVRYPNVDPVLDPEYARRTVADAFGPQIKIAGEMRSYAADLLKRAFSTQANSLPDLIVIGHLFRQALSAFDGWLICLTEGAVDAASLHARGLWESSLYLEWIRVKGKERWTRQLYVASMRQELFAVRRATIGTAEQLAFQAACERAYGTPGPEYREEQAAITQRGQELTALLASEPYSEINASFDKMAKSGRPDPDWYKPGADAPKSIFAMAKSLNRDAEYSTLYRSYSHHVHGTRSEHHFRVTAGAVVLEPIRSVEMFSDAFVAPAGTMMDILDSIIEVYRPGEEAVFREHFVRWRPYRFVRKVVIEPTYTGY